MKRVSVLAIICVFLMGLFTPSVFAEKIDGKYYCDLTINANVHTFENQAFPKNGCYGQGINSDTPLTTGYWDGSVFTVTKGTQDVVKDGDVFKVSAPGPNWHVRVHTIAKKEPVIEEKTETKTESVNFKTVRKNDSSLKKGKTKVSQNGKKGVRTITYKVTYTDGKETNRKKISDEVTTKPVNKVILVGTKVIKQSSEKEPAKDKQTHQTEESTSKQTTHQNGNDSKTHHTTKTESSLPTHQDEQESVQTGDTDTEDEGDTADDDQQDNERVTDEENQQESKTTSSDESNKEENNMQEKTTSSSVVEGALDTHETTTTTVDSTIQSDESPASSLGWWIGGIVVLIIIGGIGYWLYTRYKKE